VVRPVKSEPLSDAAIYYSQLHDALREEFSQLKAPRADPKSKKGKSKKTLIGSRSTSDSMDQHQHVTVIHVPEARTTMSIDDFGASSPLKGSSQMNASYESVSASRADVTSVVTSLEEEYDVMNQQYKHLVQSVKRQGGDSAQAAEMIAVLQRLQKKEEQIKRLRGEY
jgi:hypothetical protein